MLVSYSSFQKIFTLDQHWVLLRWIGSCWQALTQQGTLSPFITAARHWLRDMRLCWKARTNYPKKKNIFSVFRKLLSAVCHKVALDVSLLSCVSRGCVHFIIETVSPFPGWSQAWLLLQSVGKVLCRSGANDDCLLFPSAMAFDIFTFNGHQNKDVCAPSVPQHRKTKALGDLSKVC